MIPPSATRCVAATVPADVAYETLDPAALPGWDDPRDVGTAQAFRRAWLASRRTALLLVPSVVTGGRDTNAVLNPDHSDGARIDVGPEVPVVLDRRLPSAVS